jgi:hypothetical protein
MKETRWMQKSFALLAIFFVSGPVARAQANRTFVSGVGDDANACTRSVPCRTFAGALTKTRTGGEIDTVDTGGYGTFSIGKAVTIDGGGGLATILASDRSNGVFVNAGPNDVVVLRHLSINGLVQTGNPGTNGVKVNAAKAVYVIDCLIQNFANDGIDFEPTGGGALFVRDSAVINNGGPSSAGIFVKSPSGSAQASIENTRADGNSVGIWAKDNSRVSVSDSVVSKNVSTGLVASSDSGAPAEMNVERSVVTLNAVGIQSGGCTGRGPATVRISNVSVTSNSSAGLSFTTILTRPGCGKGDIISSKNNTVLGNNPDGAPTQTIVQQ